MKWVTREKAKVDRIAYPWLITHFVDPNAEFLYAPTDQVNEVAKREDAHSLRCGGRGADPLLGEWRGTRQP